MGKRPPTYTFQRPRKRQPPPIPVANPQAEMYTVIDDSESSIDQTARYTRYTFFLVLVIFVLLVLGICYIQLRGLPVKVRV